jgi:SAM-dependent methyltransferase
LEYFETQVVKNGSHEVNSNRWRRYQIKYLESLSCSINKEDVILDAGCGDGIALEWFKEHGYKKVWGCDINPEKVKIASQYGYTVFEKDLHDLNLRNEIFDVIYCSHTLEHMHDPIQVVTTFRWILRNGGKLFVVVPFPDTGPDDAHCGKEMLGTSYHFVKQYGISLLENIFTRNGFRLIKDDFSYLREPEIQLILEKVQ